jgi:hypothetical protein
VQEEVARFRLANQLLPESGAFRLEEFARLLDGLQSIAFAADLRLSWPLRDDRLGFCGLIAETPLVRSHPGN